MSKRRINNSKCEYQLLENRQLLAGITFDADSGTVNIEGTSHGDQVYVLNGSDSQIKIRFEGVEETVFDRSIVQSITFRGLGGNDYFENRTDKRSRAFGNNGDDTLIGGDNRDRIRGGKGNDRIEGRNGNDFLHGGKHQDSILGGEGNDEIVGSFGADSLHGQQGNDAIDAGADNDLATGGQGNDVILGRNGDDDLRGGGGHDEIRGHNGNDIIQGSVGNDDLFGNAGHDSVYGGSNDDNLYGGSGFDNLFGGQGLDDIFGGLGDDDLDGGSNSDFLRGGEGNDDYQSDSSDNVIVDSSDFSFDGDFEIRGEITGFNSNNGTFLILGIPVQIANAQFVAPNINNGSFVKAEGSFNGNVLDAREVEFELNDDRDENLEARGTIQNLNTANQSFSFFGFNVSYAGAHAEGQLANGIGIELKGRLTGNQIQAFEIETATGAGQNDDGDHDQDEDQDNLSSNIELSGNISNYNLSAQTFELLGLTIDFSSAQIQGNFGNGSFVKVDGQFGPAAIAAREIEVDQPDDNNENFEGTGPIQNLTESNQTFVLFGFVVDYSDAEIETNLAVNAVVSVEGQFLNGNITADRIR